jgi:16S rRNA (adenine(1408)-N(1))-methyltransferase
MDIGTGDGRAVLARATAEPCSLVIGVDANSAAMAEASRRAERRGPANALFLAAAAEALPDSFLAGRADLVTVAFPWGSLLRGLLAVDGGSAALAGTASALRCGGDLEVLTSVMPTDGVAGLSVLDKSAEPAIRCAWQAAGLELTGFEPADASTLASIASSWSRRLRGGGSDRPVWRLTGRRVGG